MNKAKGLIALIVAGAAIPAISQSDDAVLEEVIVTSQKRAQSLQDVPISVNVVSADKLSSANITKIEELQSYVPNLNMSETGIGTNIYIRGIGSGINQGFEQSVGMYVDSVYYGRGQLARAPFLDLERVEVLRGSQNILHGKNSIAGALNITTAQPTDELQGHVSVIYEPHYNERVADLVASGGLGDNARFRVAHRTRLTDGYMKNEFLNEDEPDRNENTTRLTFSVDPTDRLTATLKLEEGKFDVQGRQIEIVTDEPSLNPTLGGLNYSQILVGSFGAPASMLDTELDYKRTSGGDFSHNDMNNATFKLDYDFETVTLTSITANLAYEFEELCDCDFTAADLFTVRSEEDYTQLSQEFRLSSETGGLFEWIAGYYYQKSQMKFRDNFQVSMSSLLPNIVDAVLPGDPTLGPVYPIGTGQKLRGIQVPRLFDQDTEINSLFGQVTLNMTDMSRLTLGLRYSEEKKSGFRSLTVRDAAGNLIPFDDSFIPGVSMGLDFLLSNVFQVLRHDGSAGAPVALQAKREKSNVSPMINMQFDVTDSAMLYITGTKGFKAGGYDARSNAPAFATTLNTGITNTPGAVGTFAYDDEEATNIELGWKQGLAGGKAELNIALFHTEYENLQVSIYDGVLGFNVGNAAEAVSTGLEVDGRYRVHDYVTLSGSIAYLDFDFKDYDNGQCTQVERITTGNTDCSYDGKTNQYVSEWSGTLTTDVAYPVGNLMLYGTLDIIFTDDYNPSQNLDPMIEQDAYTKLNLRLALGNQDMDWEVALIGKNITDEEIIAYANDTPLSANLFQSPGHYAFVEPGDTWALQGIYRF